MFGERKIPVNGHSETIRPDTHLNRSALRLKKFGTIVFAKNISRYWLEFHRLSLDNIRNEVGTSKTSYNIAKDFVGESVHNVSDADLPGLEESNISANLNETSISIG